MEIQHGLLEPPDLIVELTVSAEIARVDTDAQRLARSSHNTVARSWSIPPRRLGTGWTHMDAGPDDLLARCGLRCILGAYRRVAHQDRRRKRAATRRAVLPVEVLCHLSIARERVSRERAGCEASRTLRGSWSTSPCSTRGLCSRRSGR